MYVMIINARTGHKQKIQKRAWVENENLYTGYHAATDNELQEFDKAIAEAEAKAEAKAAEAEAEAALHEIAEHEEGESITGDNPEDESKPKKNRKKKSSEDN